MRAYVRTVHFAELIKLSRRLPAPWNHAAVEYARTVARDMTDFEWSWLVGHGYASEVK